VASQAGMRVGSMQPDEAERVVAVAVRAPSLHNTQPWLFSLRDGALDVRADLSRRLPGTDPDGRQMLSSDATDESEQPCQPHGRVLGPAVGTGAAHDLRCRPGSAGQTLRVQPSRARRPAGGDGEPGRRSW
jgi:nitroreductase